MSHEHLTVKCNGCRQSYCIRCFEPTGEVPRAATSHAVHVSAEPTEQEQKR